MKHDRLTAEELAALPAKTKRDPRFVAPYLEHDFLTAYSMHTDLRVSDNPQGAIGNPADWDRHGNIQNDFLISRGMRPEHRLLDIGCGTGRLARKAAPYLNRGNYTGVDISSGAIDHASRLSFREGWAEKWPVLITSRTLDVSGTFDFVWAFSVVIHLPDWKIREMFAKVATLMHNRSQFLFSYVPEKVTERTGLKQFRATLAVYQDAVEAAGMRFAEVKWPAQQRIGLATLC